MTMGRSGRLAVIRSAATLCAGLIALLAACEESAPPAGPAHEPHLTMGTGTQSTLIGRATFQPFHVKRKTGGWEVDIKAKDAMDVAVQSITFQPGGQSGWHRHPGPVLIQVATGTMTFYEADDPTCTPIVRTAGEGYLDAGHGHIARNESGAPALNVVTYFAPPGAVLRIDAPAPGNCAF